MITEDYVSFETAKLLKEKGFDGLCYKVWESQGDSTTLVGAAWFVEGETVVNRELVDTAAKRYADEWNLNDTVDGYLAPTLQMAMKWLREVHNLVVNPVGHYVNGKLESWEVDIYFLDCGVDATIDAMGHVYGKTYEIACENGIEYCIENLI